MHVNDKCKKLLCILETNIEFCCDTNQTKTIDENSHEQCDNSDVNIIANSGIF